MVSVSTKRGYFAGLIWLALAAMAPARQEPVVCGTTREGVREALHLHRQGQRIRRLEAIRRHGAGAAVVLAQPAVAVRGAPGYPDIALIEDAGGVVARVNAFNLDRRTLIFRRTDGGAYRYELAEASYDASAAEAGSRLALEDDDSRAVPLPFRFPFFGQSYDRVYVNSDGNLTFGAGDAASSERSLGRVTAGPPRIAGLFRDLDPSLSRQGVWVLAAPERFVVSWVAVPEYREFGVGPLQTFQIRLYPDGRIEFAYNGITTSSAVVGIAPGNLQGETAVICFVCQDEAGRSFTAAVLERFGATQEIDVVTAAQVFLQAHEDAYDYLVIFNALGINAGESAVAYEITVRNHATGIGDPPRDYGREFGSRRRLKAVVNMGPLSQYPSDPFAPLDRLRPFSRESTVAILAHEVGHLFLAYASIRDPMNPGARPLLGRQLAHWSFVFNSEASHLEGNRIRDDGPAANPRFLTIANSEQYAPLDQYLMGFRAPEEVEPVFLVTNATVSGNRSPQRGVAFHGQRLDVRVEDIIAAEGPRRPDHTVAQRRFRAAFLLVVPKGFQVADEDLQKLERLREAFENYYRESAGGRAQIETTLRRALHVSAFPAAGVFQGSSIPVTIAIEKPAEAPLTISLRAAGDLISVPPTVSIPAGATEARFQLTGLRAGIEELRIEPADSRYETVWARIRVAATPSGIRPVVVSGDKQIATPGQPLPEPVVVRVMDENYVPYPGVRVQAAASPGGSVSPAEAVTDENGTVSFRWTPGRDPLNELTVTALGSSAVATALGKPAVAAEGVVNAASGRPSLAPGTLASVFGANLAAGLRYAAPYPWPRSVAGIEVRINGIAVPLLWLSDRQVNFLIPLEMPEGDAELVVRTPLGASDPVRIRLLPAAPGIFFDPVSQTAAVLIAGTASTTAQRPAEPGDYLEIYATGLGAVESPGGALRWTRLKPRVFLAGRELFEVTYHGLAPGYLGLYQINVKVPEGLPSGSQPLRVEAGGAVSNEVHVVLR